MWVGGTKPGRIDFLGETKFAPGEWAGVVLDEPVGKNDGSVGGVSYFKASCIIHPKLDLVIMVVRPLLFTKLILFTNSSLDKD